MAIGWPLASNKIRRGMVNHTFGMVRRYPNGAPKPHQGWDLEAAVGTDVFAIEDGRIEFAGTRAALGKIILQSFSANGTQRIVGYAHLSVISVSTGSPVTKGQLIGKTGRTGNASGLPAADMHLHLEFRVALFPGTGLTGRIDPTMFYGQGNRLKITRVEG